MRRTAIAALGLLVAVSAPAQELHGYIDGKGIGFLRRASVRDPDAIGWGTLFLEGRGALAKSGALAAVHWKATLRAEAITSDERGPLRFDAADRDLRRSPLSIREAYVVAPLGEWVQLQVGRFALGWGKTDGYSPADAFLPRDLSDPFADERLPLTGARLSAQHGSVRAELLWAATTTPWRLPVLEGRYAPFPIAGVVLVDGQSDPPRDGFGAMRVTATRGEWDFGVWARSGLRPAPLFVFRPDLARPAPDAIELPVDRRWVREQGAGIEASRVVGAWVVRAEAAALDSDDDELGDALLWSAGAERAFGDGTLIVTIAGNARSTPVEASLLLDRAILPAAIAAWNRTEEWGSWRLVATAGLEHGDGLIEAEVVHALDDAWGVTAGFDLPFGPRRGPFGALRDAQRLRLAVRRSW